MPILQHQTIILSLYIKWLVDKHHRLLRSHLINCNDQYLPCVTLQAPRQNMLASPTDDNLLQPSFREVERKGGRWPLERLLVVAAAAAWASSLMY
jgi:hypothetical protein